MTISRCLLGVLLALSAADAADAQRAALPRSAAGVTVSGVVFDSLTNRPLASAIVQLVNAENPAAAAPSSVSDSLGRYAFEGVAAGRYLLGFLHPVLDSVGLDQQLRQMLVDSTRNVRQDLGLPSANTIRLTVCGAAAVADSDAVILGVVRHATSGQTLDSAIVTAEWIDMFLERGRMSRSRAIRQVRSRESGRFAICGAPSGGIVQLTASRGTDTTAALELEVPKEGFLRRDLYFGVARLAAGDAAAASSDSIAERRFVGDGRLSGTVVATVGGRPLAGARVGIRNGPQTRTDDRGTWTLTRVPTGTRTLEVRALAHYPVSMPVDVVDGAPAVRVAMVTMRSVLDTVRITAARRGNTNLLDFLARKRSAASGYFLTGEQIAQRRPVFTTDLFRGVPGVFVGRDRNGQEILTMRGITGRCPPSIFVNGMSMRGLTASEVNSFFRPEDIVGLEVYPGISAPGQFRDFDGCGSIVVWSR